MMSQSGRYNRSKYTSRYSRYLLIVDDTIISSGLQFISYIDSVVSVVLLELQLSNLNIYLLFLIQTYHNS
jgi:hypothetical protein